MITRKYVIQSYGFCILHIVTLMLIDIFNFHHGIFNGNFKIQKRQDLNACLAISDFKGP